SERFPAAPLGLLFPGDPDPVFGRVPRGGYPPDKNNFAPRFGLAYSPRPQSGLLRFLFGNSSTAIRGGAGIFYDQATAYTVTRFSFVQPFSVSQSLGGTQIQQGGGSFGNPFGPMPNPWPIDLSKRSFTGQPDVHTLDPEFSTAQTYQYNLMIQRELGWSVLMEAAYVGSTSIKLSRLRELNTATLGKSRFDSKRPYQQLGSIASQESSGDARYDSFQFRIARRPTKGLMIDGSYVWAKPLDNGSNLDNLSGPDQLRWARSSFDRRHNVVVSYSYDLPAPGFRWSRGILSGWQIAGISEFRSGMPIDIFQFPSATLNGPISFQAPDIIAPYTRFNPREVRTLSSNGGSRTGNFFFDPSSFTAAVRSYNQPGPSTVGRNVFDGPGINLWSFSIIKRIQFSESHQLSLRTDIRNLFNRAHFENPSLQLESPTFGQITTAAPG